MAIFGGRRNLVQLAATRSWRSDEERTELLDKLKASKLKAADAQTLIFSGDAGVRQIGLDWFLDQGDPNGIKALAIASLDQGSHARGYVKRIFPRLSDDVFTKVVDGLLKDGKPKNQRMGWDLAIEAHGALATHYLPFAVTDAPTSMRITALQRLVALGKPLQHVDLLLDTARAEDSRLAGIALQALSGVDDPRVADLMVDRFANGDATSREYAGEWLRGHARRDPSGMRVKMLELLGGGEDATRRMCVEILLMTGEPAEILLQILVYAKDLVGWLRTRILETLQTFGDRMLGPAVTLLQHEDEQVRTAALVLAERFNDPRIIKPVCALLKDEDWWLRITACDTLGRLGDERAVGPLIEALGDADTRWSAIDALAQIGSTKALKPLSRLLADKRQEVRMEVLQALSHFTDKRLLSLLQKVQQRDPSNEVRTRAAEVLRDMASRLDVVVDTSEEGVSAGTEALTRPLDKLLARARQEGFSDLHITPGEPPMVRKAGTLTRWEGRKPIDPKVTRKLILGTLGERQRVEITQNGAVDFCYSVPEVGRYRVNAYRQRKGWGAAFRVIPNAPPTFAELRLPGHLTELLNYHQGIIVVSGPAGSGKSTTLAAIVNLINESKPVHVVTLEDPIEFVHPVKVGLVNQREIGKHSESFARALRGALRQDPDVIMVGEMRDPETIRMALEAAETGHLVIATMHTTSAIQTVDRLVGSFPPDEQQAVRISISESLKYVVSQSLIPRKDGVGRVAVFEVLRGTLSVGNLIRDNKSFQLPSMMQVGRNVGMQNKDMALTDLVEADLITPEVAWATADNPDNFSALCDPTFLAGVDSGEEEA